MSWICVSTVAVEVEVGSLCGRRLGGEWFGEGRGKDKVCTESFGAAEHEVDFWEKLQFSTAKLRVIIGSVRVIA
jgi:hypothetical protein